MATAGRAGDLPRAFRAALAGLRTAELRPEVVVTEAPAPQRVAPYAVALALDVVVAGEELATGRLVALHDPAGQAAWQGPTRLVGYLKAGSDPEMVADPLLPAVGWAWLLEAFAAHDVAVAAPSGTVTRVASESFGELAGRPGSAEVELRASWSPARPADPLAGHLAAWGDVMCAAAGLPPLPAGVAALSTRRPRT